MKNLLFITGFFLLLSGCEKKDQDPEIPACIQQKIEDFKAAEPGNPPAAVFSYLYKGQTVYYIPPACCDNYSTLFNDDCEIICAPDGGLSGDGDGKCRDFFETRTNEKLIWEDSRP